MKVFINPGHDRELDPGCCNPVSGLREADVAWDIGQLVQTYLGNVGIESTCYQNDSLNSICNMANSYGADLFISIHCNGFNTVAKGTETLVFSMNGGSSQKLATCIQKQIVDSLHTTDRGLKERPGLQVLNSTDMPAVLVETAFIDNEEDVKLLINNKDDFARAIARGVTDYMNS